MSLAYYPTLAGWAHATNLNSETIGDIEAPVGSHPSPAEQSSFLDGLIRDMQDTCVSTELFIPTTTGPSIFSSFRDSRKTTAKNEDPFDPFAPFVTGDYIVVSPERNDQRLVEGSRFLHVMVAVRDPNDVRKVLKDRSVVRALVPVPKDHFMDIAGFEKAVQQQRSRLLFEDVHRGDYVLRQHPHSVSPGVRESRSISGFHFAKNPGASPSWTPVRADPHVGADKNIRSIPNDTRKRVPIYDQSPQNHLVQNQNIRPGSCVDYGHYAVLPPPAPKEYWFVTPNTEFSHGLSFDTAGSHPPPQIYFSEDDVRFCDPRETVAYDPLKEVANSMGKFDRGSWDYDVYEEALPGPVPGRKRKATEAPASARPKKQKTIAHKVTLQDRPATSPVRIISPGARTNPGTRSLPSKTFIKPDNSDDDIPTTSSSSSTSDKPFRCYMDTCNISFDDLADVPVHFRKAHGSAKRFRCAYRDCERTTHSIGDMARHELALAHKEPSFMCKKCGVAFTREDARKRHAAKCSAKSTVLLESSVS